tara:strand:+ start:1322 stop:1642 length:321 start_codon:yes stop_codon:yes gene_type:complete
MSPAHKYRDNFRNLEEELLTAATQYALAWKFGNWTARQRMLTVHERLLRNVRCDLQELYDLTNIEEEEFRKEFIRIFNLWVKSLPKLAKEQLDLIKNYTEVFVDED